jgi:hypothetical protein
VSRFVDPEARRTVPLGPCDCPGTPHEQDEAYIRDRLSGQEIAQYAQSSNETAAEVTAEFVLGWNLLGNKGEAVAVTAASLLLLDAQSLSTLVNAISDVVVESSGAVPNGSGARSRASSRASASRTRTTRPRR